jgi:hypothetical protein
MNFDHLTLKLVVYKSNIFTKYFFSFGLLGLSQNFSPWEKLFYRAVKFLLIKDIQKGCNFRVFMFYGGAIYYDGCNILRWGCNILRWGLEYIKVGQEYIQGGQ